MPGNFITISEGGLGEAIQALERPKLGIDSQYLRKVQSRYARKHFVPEMKANAPFAKLGKMVAVTQRVKYTGPRGVRVGVVKNDAGLFPTFSAQATASVFEYGTQERFRHCLLYTSPSPRDGLLSRMPSSA